MNANGNVAVLERVFEAEVGGRIVNRIAAEDHQHVNLARAHVANEIFQRVVLAGGACEDGLGVEDGLADIAELFVYGVSESMNNRRLVVARNYQTRTPSFAKMVKQIHCC